MYIFPSFLASMLICLVMSYSYSAMICHLAMWPCLQPTLHCGFAVANVRCEREVNSSRWLSIRKKWEAMFSRTSNICDACFMFIIFVVARSAGWRHCSDVIIVERLHKKIVLLSFVLLVKGPPTRPMYTFCSECRDFLPVSFCTVLIL